jgi:hypothetical protein
MYYLTWSTKKGKIKKSTAETVEEVYRWLSTRVTKEQICWVGDKEDSFGEHLAGTQGDDSGVYTVFQPPFTHDAFEKVYRFERYGLTS